MDDFVQRTKAFFASRGGRLAIFAVVIVIIGILAGHGVS